MSRAYEVPVLEVWARDWVQQLEGLGRLAGLGQCDCKVGGVADQAGIGRACARVAAGLQALLEQIDRRLRLGHGLLAVAAAVEHPALGPVRRAQPVLRFESSWESGRERAANSAMASSYWPRP